MIDPKLRFASCAAAILLAGSLSACGDNSSTDTVTASESVATNLSIADAWSRQPATGQTTAAVYATVSNPTDADVTIVAASSPVTPDVELHETVSNDDGTMSMRQATDGFIVPAGGEFTFDAGGAHIMLVGIDPAAYPTDHVEVTLEFDGAAPMTFEATVQALTGDDASTTDSMADMHHDDDTMTDMDHESMSEDDHDHAADEEPSADDPLDVQWLHVLDDELAAGTLDADRQRQVVAPFIAHYEEMAPADGTDEAELLATLQELDQALADQDLDQAATLATAAHEAAHQLEAHT